MNSKYLDTTAGTNSLHEFDHSSMVEEIISKQERDSNLPVETQERATAVPIQPFVGTCNVPQHPTLMGRALIQWQVDRESTKRWLPVLHGMSLRKGDHVLVQPAVNSIEPIVTGVIDGFEKRPESPKNEIADLKLLPDESIIVTTEDNQKLIEIQRNEKGPVVKLFQQNTQIDLPNRLCLTAKSIEFKATQGDAKISASDYVRIDGEKVKLNS